MMTYAEALAYMKSNDGSDTVAALYDEDPALGDALAVLLPGYEYPDISHKTIGQLLRLMESSHGKA